MNDLLTTNQRLTLFSKIIKHTAACCSVILLLLVSVSGWAQYCTPTFSNEVYPITYVHFGSIQNTTDPFFTNVGYEDFTDQSTQVIPGETYPISLSGKTGVNSTSYFWVFVDWNQNGVLDDDGEVYPIGNITNSNGFDDKMSFGNIEVPIEAIMGITRMRVIKSALPIPITPCFSSFNGQAEDYSIIVTSEFIWDCPALEGNVGYGCDDGDPNTINDVIGEDCVCAGIDKPAGMECEDPIQVLSLPYLTNDSTDAYGDNYDYSDFPPLADDAIGSPSANYLTGNDVVYAYTPTEDGFIDIRITNQTASATGIFVFKGCPFEITVGGHTNQTLEAKVLRELPVIAGETYYIVISNWTAPQTTKYSLTIKESGFDCPDYQAHIGDACDDGNPLTGHDILTEDCECIGELGFSEASAIPLYCNVDPVTHSSVNSDATKPAVSYCGDNTGNRGLYFHFMGTGSVVTIHSIASFKHEIQISLGGGSYNTCATGGAFSTGIGFSTVAGETYYVYIGSYHPSGGGNRTGDITINLVCDPNTENNDCENAIALSCGSVVEVSTCEATNSGIGAVSCISDGSQEDVFYTLDVLEGVEYTISVNDEFFSNVLAIYSGECGDLFEIECSTNYSDPEIENAITFTASTSEILIIRTYSYIHYGSYFTISVTCNAVFDCPDFDANIGYACDLDEGGVGEINYDCECVPVSVPSCEFVYFLSDHDAGNGIADIYGVTLSSGVGTMNYIATSDIEVHIAYYADQDLIYAVSKHENSYRTLDPSTGAWGAEVFLGSDYGELTAAVFNHDGKLLIGSQAHKAIYIVNVNTNVVSSYDTYAPLIGGDLAYGSDGMLYMATRSGNGLYKVWSAPMSDDLIGNTLPSKVTGMAITDADQLLISAQGNTNLVLYDTDGANTMASFDLMLGGEPYTLRDGDMASGCYTEEDVAYCPEFSTFLVNHGVGISGSDIYTVKFFGGNAHLTFLTNVEFEAHIAFDAESNILILVDVDGSFVRLYDVSLNSFLGDISIVGDFTKLTAAVFSPSAGLLYVGDQLKNEIHTIDPITGASAYYGDAPVSGGDLEVLDDGTVYLGTKQGSALYKIVESAPAVLLGSMVPNVTGMARFSDEVNNFIVSSNAALELTKINAADGSTMDTYPIMLGGVPFTLTDGDMAAGCGDGFMTPPTPPVSPFKAVESTYTLTSFPNPTNGSSRVVFATAETTRTLIEVYDMNGRNVGVLFNQEAQQGEEYTLDFNGSKLPNGVYTYRMITNKATIIEKFMIAR